MENAIIINTVSVYYLNNQLPYLDWTVSYGVPLAINYFKYTKYFYTLIRDYYV